MARFVLCCVSVSCVYSMLTCSVLSSLMSVQRTVLLSTLDQEQQAHRNTKAQLDKEIENRAVETMASIPVAARLEVSCDLL